MKRVLQHRHKHPRASCAMERERLLGAAAPVVEASTSGFARDGVVRTRRDRARLAAAVAALLGCAAFAGSSLTGASVAALGDGDGPAQLRVAGEPNAWGTKHNALPWWTMPGAASARRAASLGTHFGEDEETARDDERGETSDDATRVRTNADADVLAATSAEPDDALASVEGEDKKKLSDVSGSVGVEGEDVSGDDADGDVPSAAALGTSPRADRESAAARVAARRCRRRRQREAQDARNEAGARGGRSFERLSAPKLGAGEATAREDDARDDDDVEVYAATEKERAARVAARRAARAARREREEAAGDGLSGGHAESGSLGAARQAERERVKLGYPPLRSGSRTA